MKNLFRNINSLLLFLCLFLIISNIYNINIKNKYKKLYNTNIFQVIDNMENNANMLKDEVDSVLYYGKLNDKKVVTIKEISQRLYYSYIQLSFDYSYYYPYSSNKIRTSENSNILDQVNEYTTFLETIVLSNSKSELILQEKEIKKLKIISDLCADINNMFGKYKKNTENTAEIKNRKLFDTEWLNILESLERIFDKYPCSNFNGT